MFLWYSLTLLLKAVRWVFFIQRRAFNRRILRLNATTEVVSMIGTLACAPPIPLAFLPLLFVLVYPFVMLAGSVLMAALVCPAHQFHWLERLFITMDYPLPRALEAVIDWRDSHVVVRTKTRAGRLIRAMLWGAAVTAVFTALASALVLANYYTGWPSL